MTTEAIGLLNCSYIYTMLAKYRRETLIAQLTTDAETPARFKPVTAPRQALMSMRQQKTVAW
jgi:hypothetical protein